MEKKTEKKIDEITKKLEAGVKEVFSSERYEKYLQTMSKFRNYSANNCLLIMMQNPEAQLVAGFNDWKNKFKRNVIKGQKAMYVIAPVPHKYKKVDERTGEEKEMQWLGYRAVPVFDVSQTEGEALPTIPVTKLSGTVEEYSALIEKLERLAPAGITYEEIETGANGYFKRDDNTIHIDSRMSEQQTVKTIIHEVAHSILHSETGTQKDADKRTKEVQAESVAYTVCNYLGIDTSDYSFGYIAGWSKDKTASELTESLKQIKTTADYMIEEIYE